MKGSSAIHRQNIYRFISVCFLLVFVMLQLVITPVQDVRADDPPPDLQDVRYEQHLNEPIPIGLTFQDETGRAVKLQEYFRGKPVLLVFAYYNCPNLCGLVLEDLVKRLQEINFSVGKEFEIVTVSIDPRETPDLAAGKKQLHLIEYGREGAEAGWHFLTGEQESIDQLTQAAGFQYFYDEESEQFAHPAGVMVLTPKGIISRYFFGLDYPAYDLRLGIIEAADEKIGTPVDQFLLYCYHYDPVTGRYSLFIRNILRLAGLLTVAGLAGGILYLILSERRAKLPA